MAAGHPWPKAPPGVVRVEETVPPAQAEPAPAVLRLAVRLGSFAALALFGVLHWARLLEPQPGGRLVAAVAVATAGGAVLVAVGREADRRRRAIGAGAVTLGLLLTALALAGVPARMLVPDAWDDLAGGLVQGLQALPTLLVPYRGADEWVSLTLLLGGTALVGLAAVLAFWPGAAGRVPRTPLAAAVALGTLYGTPIVERAPDQPFVGGAIFCVLLAAFLWLDRVGRDQLGLAAACVALGVAVGALVAPRLDAERPWLDYEQLAERLEPGRAASFAWDHRYGPLKWPRVGREVLRVRARTTAYWKAVNLERFDGVRWRESGRLRPNIPDTQFAEGGRWQQTIRVVDRGLTSLQFIGAGSTMEILPGSSRGAVRISPGTFVSTGRPLRPGNSYLARVYTPNPSREEMREAGTDYPLAAHSELEMDVPLAAGQTIEDPFTGNVLTETVDVRFPAFGSGADTELQFPSRAVTDEGVELLRESPYGRAYELAQRIARESATPYDFVTRVRERVQRGATYSETPGRHRYALDAFLFDDRQGYCQQFSGAMALLLRMGGVPARVSTGFSPGRADAKRREFVVRDTDAHSWVEAYFPDIGWVTFDPTPAAAPARTGADDEGDNGGAGAGGGAGLGQAGDRPFDTGDPGAGAALVEDEPWRPPLALLGLVALIAALAAGAVLVRRSARREPAPPEPDLAELHRALRRAGRPPAPDVTLARLEATLAGDERARGYLRAVRERRFRGRDAAGPTPAQRRALRSALAAGLGLRGRLRSWWALPPGRPRRAGLMRGRRPYTEG